VKEAEALFRDLGDHELRLGVVSVPNATLVAPKLVLLGVHPERVAHSLLGAFSVCGVRRNCPDCRESYHPHRLVLAEWFGNQPPPRDAGWSRGAGCGSCNGTGHKGEYLVCEFWTPTLAEREAIRKESTLSARLLREEYLHRAPGLGTRALQAAMEGWTTLEETLKVLPAEEVRSVRRAA
jgi:type II secretory ATPase GspE/PulE/Tfp pilus assembly ATPase PilB-like protein